MYTEEEFDSSKLKTETTNCQTSLTKVMGKLNLMGPNKSLHLTASITLIFQQLYEVHPEIL